MGRKKKQVKKAENKIEPSHEKKVETNMKLTYSGNVHIDFIKNRKKIRRLNSHNNGNTPLYTFLLNCLASDFREVDRPKYVFVLRQDNNNNSIFVSSAQLIANPSVISDSTSETSEPILSYKILVPSSIFTSKNTSISGLAFYSTTNLPTDIVGGKTPLENYKDYSMIMYLKRNDTNTGWDNIEVGQETDLLITWQIKIESAVQEVTEA